jgi:drug/metabolite transporter (DMT)-like permease
MAALAKLWHAMHPYAKSVTVAVSASTMIMCIIVGMAMTFDLTDAEAKNWAGVLKLGLIAWLLITIGIGAAFYNLRVLSPAQWAALDKIRKGELPTPPPPMVNP